MSAHRQIKEIRLGGKTHELRFRSHEISLLEERMMKAGIPLTVPEILQEQRFGMVFIREGLLVGVAHEYVGKRGKEARLSTQLIGKWLDKCGEDGNAEFDEVVGTLIECVVMGLPGANKAAAEAEAEKKLEKEKEAKKRAGDDDGDDDGGEAGKVSDNPLTSTETSAA